jgi:ubiquinone/menaquinone biosynthesis C-methylase UbiE
MFLAELDFYKKFSHNRSNAIATSVAPLLPASGNMLDFGCGNMYTSKEIANLVPNIKIMGVDVIEDLNLNLNGNTNIQFKKYSGQSIPFADNSFDAVLAASSLHHTHSPEFYLDEFKRVVKPGGIIVLVEEMYINKLDFFWIAWQDYVLNKMKKGVPIPLQFRSRNHYVKEFEKRCWQVLIEKSLRPNFPYQHHYVFQLKNTH